MKVLSTEATMQSTIRESSFCDVDFVAHDFLTQLCTMVLLHLQACRASASSRAASPRCHPHLSHSNPREWAWDRT